MHQYAYVATRYVVSKVNRIDMCLLFVIVVLQTMSRGGIEMEGFHVVFLQGDFFMAVAALLVLPTCLAGAGMGWDGADDN